MSSVTGADLDQLDALASSYQQRGAEIAARSLDLERRIAEAVTSFQSSLADLRVRATSAADALLDDVHGLAQTAAGTTWTGANRTAFDADLGVLRTGVETSADTLLARVDELEQRGVLPFAELLTSFGRQATGTGDAAEQTSLTLRAHVADQRAALQDAADLGWSAV